tara:strand:- start:927 stop:1730 length:804 start_codon:yes stop_codon:yes gene_type:complete
MKKNEAICIIQARVTSSRLPGKILLQGYDKPLLLHTIERIKKSKLIKKIVVATSNLKMDEIIYKICKKNRINIFRGHPNDLLSRYYNCAKKYKANTIVRITSDCPLMDYKIIDKIIKKFYSSNVDFISNTHPPVIPDGFDIEIFNFKSLKKAFFKAKKNFQREHVTPYIWDNPKKFKIKNYDIFFKKNYYKKYRLTLDYLEDYFVIWKIYNELYPKKKFFDLKDILLYLKTNNHILINKKYIKVNWYRYHLKKLKTIRKEDTKIKFL